MSETDVHLPRLQLLPIEAGVNLKIFAVNGRAGQIMPPCHCEQDIFFSVQQGLVRLNSEDGCRLLQPREGEFLPAGKVFHLEAVTDTRARLVMPTQTEICFER